MPASACYVDMPASAPPAPSRPRRRCPVPSERRASPRCCIHAPQTVAAIQFRIRNGQGPSRRCTRLKCHGVFCKYQMYSCVQGLQCCSHRQPQRQRPWLAHCRDHALPRPAPETVKAEACNAGSWSRSAAAMTRCQAVPATAAQIFSIVTTRMTGALLRDLGPALSVTIFFRPLRTALPERTHAAGS
jgi:hypothetical protein